jgi:N-methylhydantoinase A
LRFGVDTGGTFTDLVIEGLAEGLRFFKQPTTPDDPIRGLLDVVGFAAEKLGTDPRDLLGRCSSFVHGTTRATNAIVEGATARTAFVTNKGHGDILLIREGGGRRAPMDYTFQYPDPYIPRALSYEVPGRILSDGSVSEAFDEQAVVAVIDTLKAQAVEAVAVCLLWSIVNPEHENRIGALLEKHLPGVPYTLSHRLNPAIREYRRASSAAIDASLKPLMGRYIQNLDGRLREAGFGGRLLILTSAGGVLDASEIWDTPIHTIGSGPAAAPVAGRHYAKLDADTGNAIVTDAGGTTYDVGLIKNGVIPWTRETMVDRAGELHMTGFPSVDVRSIGAGGGSIGWVDRGGMLHVGPQSAGASPGPVCWGRGGTKPTVTDACLVLGYIDPDYFLGGAMTIFPEPASEAIRKDVGMPLGLSLDDAADAIFRLACERMVTAIEDLTLNQGIDPRSAVMIGGGGGAGLYSALIARRLGVERVIIPEVSAALSAAGALLSDLTQGFSSTSLASTGKFNFDLAAETIADLTKRCETFIAGPGAGSVSHEIRYSVEARYPNQVWEIDVPLRTSTIATQEDIAAFRADFHKAHEALFAVSDPTSEVEIIAWHANVRCVLPRRPFKSGLATLAQRSTSNRPVFFNGYGRKDTVVRSYESLATGETLAGPAIIESTVTTVVVPPDTTVTRLESGSLVLDLLAQSLPGQN